MALPKYERTNVFFTLINEKEESSRVSSIVPNNQPGYVVKPRFKPLPPKEGKKKKKNRSKKREETISSPKHVAPFMVVSDESKFIDDDYMHVTYSSDQDWEKNTTFDIENIFGTNSENDDINNCYTISTIHVPSTDDMQSSKLGGEVFENPFATNDYIFETSPPSEVFENPFATNDYIFETSPPSKNDDDIFTNEYTWKDNYSLVYDDTMPPVFDNYFDDNYFIDYSYNHPHETCYNQGQNDFLTQNHPSNIQLVYDVQVLYNDPTPIVINQKDFAYAENINSFMPVDHDKNDLCDGYIVDFINDATKSFMREGDMTSHTTIILSLLSFC